ncbi:MAG: hypothetical protein KME27_31200 [Lyngbya sp. HA4199-MV5]|nr:hypothetical protein [Lyngbya sp. HA4199-MV5]
MRHTLQRRDLSRSRVKSIIILKLARKFFGQKGTSLTNKTLESVTSRLVKRHRGS